ncbi:serine/threonine protein kinase [Streptomyces sp. NPDC020141]|uniref:serine/threonine protein kinase n=1 Tax=Streptomyces sp. NPDC020141 TaxID=3365065 RepID=UPI0037A2BAC0
MPAERPDRPRRIGPYEIVATLDPVGPGQPPVPGQRFLARSGEGMFTVVLSVPLDGADRRLFADEAHAARYLTGRRLLPVGELWPNEDGPWHSAPYLPLLPLPSALAAYGGPLPETAVRALGAALAETLAELHGRGTVHGGLVSPSVVLLTADGPLLSCSGALRAAAPDGVARAGLPGLDPAVTAPEEAAGGPPGPAGDLHGFGAILAYAATGHTAPDRSELPEALRPLVSRCLSRDPAARPTAAEALGALGPPGPPALPGRVVAALARQSAALLAAEVAVTVPAPGV